MIKSFGSKATESIFKRSYVKGLSKDIQKIGYRKLLMIHAASNINDLRIPPANHLEKLKGSLRDFYSIRINDQWRICFQWFEGNAHEVKIIDYH